MPPATPVVMTFSEFKIKIIDNLVVFEYAEDTALCRTVLVCWDMKG